MNTTELSNDWEAFKAKLKLKFTSLIDSDLNFAEEKREEMLVKLQVKLNKTKEELESVIKTL